MNRLQIRLTRVAIFVIALLFVFASSCDSVFADNTPWLTRGQFALIIGFLILAGLWIIFIPISAIVCGITASRRGKDTGIIILCVFAGLLLSFIGLIIVMLALRFPKTETSMKQISLLKKFELTLQV